MFGLWNTLLYKRFVVYRKFCRHHVWMVTKCACLHRMPIMISPHSVRPRFFISLLTAADMAFWHADPQRFAHGWNKMAKGLGIRFYERLEP